MKSAFSNILHTTCSKPNLDAHDVEWILSLCNELVSRINNLTPHRYDLHKELQASFDTELIRQMLQHSAFDENDLNSLIQVLETRILMICAPSQDETLRNIFRNVNDSENIADCVCHLVLYLNQVIDDIYELLQSEGKL